jgi:2-keto-4-pentenoate hydratase
VPYKREASDKPIDARIRSGLGSQAERRRELFANGASRLGWKAGFGTEAALKSLGTDGPLVGFLSDATLLPSGASADVASWGKAVLEPEIAVRLVADVGPADGPEDVAAAIGALAPAIELVDLGLADGDVEAILAGNIFHRHFLLGEFAPIGDGLAIEDVRLDIFLDDQPHKLEADPVEMLGELSDVVGGLADILPAADDGLRAGDVIITGSAIPPFELSGGERVSVRAAGSEVSVRILAV